MGSASLSVLLVRQHRCQPTVRSVQGDDGVDPLDAFMDAEVMPEVQDREREEKARRDAARERFAQQMAVGSPVCISVPGRCWHSHTRSCTMGPSRPAAHSC